MAQIRERESRAQFGAYMSRYRQAQTIRLKPNPDTAILRGMEARLAKIEGNIEHLASDMSGLREDVRNVRDDFRDYRAEFRSDVNKLDGKIDGNLKWTLFAFAGGFVVLAGMIFNVITKVGG